MPTVLEHITNLFVAITPKMKAYFDVSKRSRTDPTLRDQVKQASKEWDEAVDAHQKAIDVYRKENLDPFSEWPY